MIPSNLTLATEICVFWDMNIYAGSKLLKVPRFMRFFFIILRDLKNGVFRNLLNGNVGSLGFNYLVKPSYFVFDGVITRHNMNIINSPRMKYSINQASLQCGRDYQIPMRLHQAIWAIDYVLSNKSTKDLSIVEIGTGRGFIMSGILSSRDFIKSSVKNPIYLFDTFSPYAVSISGGQESQNGVHPFYAESIESVKNSFSKWPNVNIIQGLLPESLNQASIGSIGFLHLDLNNPKVELEVLIQLWPKIQIGGVVISDDYGYLGFDETYKTLNNFFGEVGATVLTSAYGQGIVIKTA